MATDFATLLCALAALCLPLLLAWGIVAWQSRTKPPRSRL